MIPIKNFTPIGTEPELPPGYRECEYLIFDGSSWIETDITPDNRLLTFEANALLDFSVNNRDGCLLGSRNISNYVGGITVWYNTVTKPDNGFGGVRVVSSGMTTWVPIQADTGLLHKIEYDGASVYIDGKFQFSGRYGVIENLSYPNIKIGCLASEGSNLTDRPFLGKVGIIKFWQDGVPVSCFIPALDPSGVPCMYDTVGKKPYYNRGTGNFSYKTIDRGSVYLYDASDFVKGECYTQYGNTNTSTFGKGFLDGKTHSGIIYAGNEPTGQYSPVRWACRNYHILDHLIIGNDVTGTSAASVYGITDDGTYELIGEGPRWTGRDTIVMTKFKPYKKFEIRCHRPGWTNRVYVYWIDAYMRY